MTALGYKASLPDVLSAMLLAQQHATVELVGLFGDRTSRAGRALYALKLTGSAEADASPRPAILVVANPDGPGAFPS